VVGVRGKASAVVGSGRNSYGKVASYSDSSIPVAWAAESIGGISFLRTAENKRSQVQKATEAFTRYLDYCRMRRQYVEYTFWIEMLIYYVPDIPRI